jgi:DNA-binding transcriptional LysR family regulator
MNNLDTDLLRSFLAVVDCGSVTRAAEQVHRTQSAVSMQLRRLEEAVGKPLFVRGGRALALTADGETLVGYARRMIQLNDEAMAQFSGPELRGRVRLGVPDDYVARFLPTVLVRFADAYPMVEVEVSTDNSHQLDDMLRRDQLDLALISCAAVEDPGELIHREPMAWVVSANHLVHEARPVPLAVTEPGCQMRAQALAALDRVGRPYRIAYSSRSYTGLASFVTAGLAVAAVAESSVTPAMRVLTDADGYPAMPPVDVGLRRAPGPRTDAVETLADALVESVRGAASLAA